MKIVIDKRQLLLSLQRVQGIVERRSTMPILSNVLIETTNGGIHVVATDLEIGVRGFYPGIVHDTGGITLSARKLFEIVRELPEGEVTLSTEENHRAIIQAGRSHFKMIALPPGDFPALPAFVEKEMVPMSSDMLQDLIKRTVFATADGDTRQILNGILLEISVVEKQTRIRVVGTDGHRLSLAEKLLKDVDPPWKESDAPRQIVIPKKAVLEIRRLLEEGETDLLIGLMKNQIGFKFGQLFLMSRLLEGTYPNYQQVIPPQADKFIKVNRSDFEGVLKRVVLFSREKTHAVVMEVSKGRALLSSNDPEVGEAKEDLPVEYEGEKLTIGFNARYLLEALGAMDTDSAIIEIQNALSPCVLRQDNGKDYLWVVMPLRLQEL